MVGQLSEAVTKCSALLVLKPWSKVRLVSCMLQEVDCTVQSACSLQHWSLSSSAGYSGPAYIATTKTPICSCMYLTCHQVHQIEDTAWAVQAMKAMPSKPAEETEPEAARGYITAFMYPAQSSSGAPDQLILST